MCRSIASVVLAVALVSALSGCSSTTDPDDVVNAQGVSDYFAMIPGSSYEFDVDWYEEDRATDITGIYTITCLGYEQHGGHQSLQVREIYELFFDNGDSTWTWGHSDTSYYRLTDTQVLSYPGGSQDAIVLLQEPLITGAAWTSAGATIEVASTSVTVNVPAGSFPGCLAIGEQGEPAAMYWSPQVGFFIRMLVGGDDWEHLTELASYQQ